MKFIWGLYRDAYSGLSQPAWMLSLIMLINRSGAMILPFLGVYLTDHLHFSLKETGTILSIFGLGAMCGSLFGGWLSDKIGSFKVQFFSLLIGGTSFFLLSTFKSFSFLAVGFFVSSIITESLRPANASSIAAYAKPENMTKAFSLNRMAINLGFSVGPALGGLLAAVSYRFLFWADGITCIAAAIIFFLYFNKRKEQQIANTNTKAIVKSKSPFTDWPFVLFMILVCAYAATFFQFLTIWPLFYRDVFHLSEGQIGALLAFNGAIVFIFEMPIIEKAKKMPNQRILIVWGTLFSGLAFALLNLSVHLAGLYMVMFALCFSEILVMPFLATITAERSGPENRGAYMGFFAFSFSAAFVLAPYLGTRIVERYGYANLWWGTVFFSIVLAIGFYLVLKMIKVSVVRNQ